jgi:hypothetical protein
LSSEGTKHVENDAVCPMDYAALGAANMKFIRTRML